MFLDSIREEHQRGATILISTHTISAGEEIATDIAILLDGKLAAAGSMEELCRKLPGKALEEIYHLVAKGRAPAGLEVIAA
jgi:ABC-type multidrug transport system ATPase subunit